MKADMNHGRFGRSPSGRSVTALWLLILAMACAGCQTFSLSEADFERQQQGKMVDQEVGGLVGGLGTLGYYGAVAGEAAAALAGK